MSKASRVLLVVMAVSLLASSAYAAGFTDSAAIQDTDPSDLSESVRIEEPYQETATAVEKKATAATYRVQINSTNSTQKVYYIEKDRITPFEHTGKVTMLVNGEPTSYESVTHLNRSWVKFSAPGAAVTVEFQPTTLSVDGGSIGSKVKFLMLDNPILVGVSSVVILFAVFLGFSNLRAEKAVWKQG